MVTPDPQKQRFELDARTLYQAFGLAIDRFRRCERVSNDPQGMHEFTVESREPSTQHRLTRNMFDAWLRRPGGSPEMWRGRASSEGFWATWHEPDRDGVAPLPAVSLPSVY
jgi:hypothetical protein